MLSIGLGAEQKPYSCAVSYDQLHWLCMHRPSWCVILWANASIEFNTPVKWINSGHANKRCLNNENRDFVTHILGIDFQVPQANWREEGRRRNAFLHACAFSISSIQSCLQPTFSIFTIVARKSYPLTFSFVWPPSFVAQETLTRFVCLLEESWNLKITITTLSW